ncbi:MAG: septal ring lytic transglycosylase RlpA family protein [Acidimicrobiales bacterium]
MIAAVLVTGVAYVATGSVEPRTRVVVTLPASGTEMAPEVADTLLLVAPLEPGSGPSAEAASPVPGLRTFASVARAGRTDAPVDFARLEAAAPGANPGIPAPDAEGSPDFLVGGPDAGPAGVAPSFFDVPATTAGLSARLLARSGAAATVIRINRVRSALPEQSNSQAPQVVPTTAPPTTAPPTTAPPTTAPPTTAPPTTAPPTTAPPTTAPPTTGSALATAPAASTSGEPFGSGNSEAGVASWFGAPKSTCAHKTLPKGTIVRVIRVSTGADTTCRVADRGPYIEGRIIDLSTDTFARLAPIGAGVMEVRIEW